MLQLGLESASEKVLHRLRKGIALPLVAKVLRTLAASDIGIYLYVMFGTPGETSDDAARTRDFVATHAPLLSGMNTALLNLPLGYPAEEDVQHYPFDGVRLDLALYTGFSTDDGWDRRAARHFLERDFSRVPEIDAVLRRTPPVFGPNHAVFFLHGP